MGKKNKNLNAGVKKVILKKTEQRWVQRHSEEKSIKTKMPIGGGHKMTAFIEQGAVDQLLPAGPL